MKEIQCPIRDPGRCAYHIERSPTINAAPMNLRHQCKIRFYAKNLMFRIFGGELFGNQSDICP